MTKAGYPGAGQRVFPAGAGSVPRKPGAGFVLLGKGEVALLHHLALLAGDWGEGFVCLEAPEPRVEPWGRLHAGTVPVAFPESQQATGLPSNARGVPA